ncbi:ABC transporter permease [Desulfatitalea alkaliphila]|uniref:Transport permease protein n=1 Tax=Desulfatitalea alkaliphila TaxID=2929485 RepID=A0AA41UGX4_9BACT|nr:ABC transporter permease [Desulfatitalea alkaliphila]MCJ8498990.1 ABC transporter permease [Desulfatitalea alkaliphila]
MSRIQLSAISPRFRHIWFRNLITYRRIWQVNFIVPLLEPGFYILAFGLGFSGLIGGVSYAGLDLAYTRFMAPALVATACMWNAFFETTYTSFVRMYYQKTFDGILATPISLEEIIVAEIVWAASKAAAAVSLMLIVLIPIGYANFPGALACIPLAFLGGLAFGAIGMFFTGIIPTIDMFNLPIFLFITPMFLFSGTFFPVSGIPDWAAIFTLIFPLYHLVELTRFFCIGAMESNPVLNVTYLVLFTVLFTYLGLLMMKRRLIN